MGNCHSVKYPPPEWHTHYGLQTRMTPRGWKKDDFSR
jgi:hypothetical protein